MKKKLKSVEVIKPPKFFEAVSKEDIEAATSVLRAVKHPLRQQIIELLEENEKMTVTDLYIKLRLEQSVASQHLAILRRAGVVETERQGKFIYYQVNPDKACELDTGCSMITLPVRTTEERQKIEQAGEKMLEEFVKKYGLE